MRYLLVALLLAGCPKKAPPPPVGVQHEYVTSNGKKVEYYWMRPDGPGPFPALIFIHGHQFGDRPGGRDLVDRGGLARFAAIGVVAVSLSQPGYGDSDGPPDYCGPATQDATLAVLGEVRRWSFVARDRIALYGVSRGAIVASMVETRDHDLAAVVLVSGMFDLERMHDRVRREEQTVPEVLGIADNIEREAGTTAEAYAARSAARHAAEIQTPTLILNGAQDPRIDPAEIEAFGKAIGPRARVVVYPQFGHAIDLATRNQEIGPFLKERLGINVY
jgi:dipeptidyl aminopeptidase/acylaminoacyl peptidase